MKMIRMKMTLKKLLKNQEFPKKLFDKNRNQIYWENSNGFWVKSEYDSNNDEIYFENSNGIWVKREYDSNGMIYYEDSEGELVDNRPKENKIWKLINNFVSLYYNFKQ